MRRALGILTVLVIAQALLLGLYLVVRESREDETIFVERVSRPAPELVLRSSDGAQTLLSDLRGSTVVLHFWATWCEPCRDELPSLLDFASSGSTVVRAVSVDPGWEAVRSFVSGPSIAFVCLAPAETVSDAFGVEELPQTFVIDAAGTVRLHFFGAQDWDSRRLRAMIAAL